MTLENKHIVMLASENGAIVNGKVGGLADVIRDLPNALANHGLQITVITPAYGFLHKDNPSKMKTMVSFPFSGKILEGEIWEVTAMSPHENVTHLVFEHPDIRGTSIYSNDPLGQSFAQDATKFALFCSATGQYIKTIDPSTIIHLHDWHTSTLILLKELHPDFIHLKKNKIVLTIHNLAYQGNRSILGKNATVERWFPELFKDTAWIQKWKDPRYKEPQFTPLAAGIEYADKVNTVSPTYAEEILKPSDHDKGFYGGEGLEKILQQAEKENRLTGILNGIEYPSQRTTPKIQLRDLCDLFISEVQKENKDNPDTLFDKLLDRIDKIKNSQTNLLFTSITRITEQKIRLLFEKGSNNKLAIDEILETLSEKNGLYILLGTDKNEYTDKCEKAFTQHNNLIYLKLSSIPIAEALYANGTIFIMPSSFEPCGISQMLAMKNGQPCIVHAVGGLKDTVIDGVNGFQFSGTNIQEQVDNLVVTTKKAIDIYLNDKSKWEKIKLAAVNARFEWKESAEKYIAQLY